MLFSKRFYLFFFLCWLFMLYSYHFVLMPTMYESGIILQSALQLEVAVNCFPLWIIAWEILVWRIKEVTNK